MSLLPRYTTEINQVARGAWTILEKAGKKRSDGYCQFT